MKRKTPTRSEISHALVDLYYQMLGIKALVRPMAEDEITRHNARAIRAMHHPNIKK